MGFHPKQMVQKSTNRVKTRTGIAPKKLSIGYGHD